MAIKIDTESSVRVIRPTSKTFTLEELNDCIDGFIEPIKIGPVWVMYDEKAKESGEPKNKVASFFFNVALYGVVLIVPPQQLPKEWDLMSDADRRYTPDDIDSGVLLSLQSALMNVRVFGAPGKQYIDDLSDRFLPQEEYTYSPKAGATIDENTQDFYDKVYDYIVQNPEQFKKNIAMSSSTLLVKLSNDDDRKLLVNQMIDFFLTQEAYEKCAILKKVL